MTLEFPVLRTATHTGVQGSKQLLQTVWLRGREQRIGQVAGSLTFVTVLSIVPLLAIALLIRQQTIDQEA